MSVENTLKERSRYGSFENHSILSQKLKNSCNLHRSTIGCLPLPPELQESLDMILHKIARIMNGDCFYDDNWHDIQGYAKLAEDIIKSGKYANVCKSMPTVGTTNE